MSHDKRFPCAPHSGPARGHHQTQAMNLADLAGQMERIERERDEARAACAEMRALLDPLIGYCGPWSDVVWRVEHALSSGCGKDFVRFEMPKLHPATSKLVLDFAKSLAEKLCAAEKKHGYSDGWAIPDAEDWPTPLCCEKLAEHLRKGDPLDVAAYCAFLWYHKLSTAPALKDFVPRAELDKLRECAKELVEALQKIVKGAAVCSVNVTEKIAQDALAHAKEVGVYV